MRPTAVSEKIWSASAQARTIHEYEVRWTQHDWPIDWAAVFGRAGPLRLEIGFGNGSYLAEQAEKHTEANYIGVDISWSSLSRLLKRLHKYKLTNGRGAEVPGKMALERLFAEASLDEIVINHPDPWAKDKHFTKVIIQPEFVRLLASRLRPGGRVTIATDHVTYAEWIVSVLENQQDIQSCFDTTVVHSLPGRTPTKYEKKFLDAGQPIHYFVWERAEQCQPDLPTPNSPFGDMPNILFKVPYGVNVSLEVEPGAICESHEGLDYVIKFLRAYRQTNNNNLLVEVLVIEGELTQQFGIAVLHRDEDCLLKLAQVGHPRPTHGVKRAVWHVGKMLQQQVPELEIRSNSVEPLD
jgi:tRNA (guanine-N7-)-methyltransferase